MGNSGSRGVHIGLTSIVVLFVVIALTVFAVLSVSTAAQEKRLAEKYAASVSAYWAADAECAALANAFGALRTGAAGGADIKKLAADAGAKLLWEGGALLVSYERPIGETAVLSVTLRLGEDFRIDKWRMVSVEGNWNPDDRLPVWQGALEETT